MYCCTDTNHSGRWPTLENQSLISSFCCFSDVLLCYWQLIQWLNSGLRYWSQSTTSLLNIIYSNVASNSKISTFYIVLHAWRVCEIRSQYNKGIERVPFVILWYDQIQRCAVWRSNVYQIWPRSVTLCRSYFREIDSSGPLSLQCWKPFSLQLTFYLLIWQVRFGSLRWLVDLADAKWLFCFGGRVWEFYNYCYCDSFFRLVKY